MIGQILCPMEVQKYWYNVRNFHNIRQIWIVNSSTCRFWKYNLSFPKILRQIWLWNTLKIDHSALNFEFEYPIIYLEITFVVNDVSNSGVYSKGDFMVHLAGLNDKKTWIKKILRDIEEEENNGKKEREKVDSHH